MKKTKLPPIAKSLPVLPPPEFKTIEKGNRIKIFYHEDFSQPFVVIRISIKQGAFKEKSDGLAFFTSQLLTRGTKNYTANRISEIIDLYGAALNVHCSWDGISINLICLSDYLHEMLDLLSDCFLNPTFSEDETERFRKKHLSEISQKLAQPDYLTSLAFNRTMFSDSPYAHPLIGNEQSIQNLSPVECKDFYKSLLTEEDISVIVAGLISESDIVKFVSKLKLTAKTENHKVKTKLKIINEFNNKFVVADKANTNQTVIKIGKFAVGRAHPDYPALQLINTVFGGYFQSRLNSIIREKHGLTYGINSGIRSRKMFSNFQITSSVKKTSTEKALNLILQEMQKISEKSISVTELKRAKNYLLGTFLRSTETIQELVAITYMRDLYDLPADYYYNFYKTISELTHEQLFIVQQKYFSPSNLVIALGGEQKYLEDIICKF